MPRKKKSSRKKRKVTPPEAKKLPVKIVLTPDQIARKEFRAGEAKRHEKAVKDRKALRAKMRSDNEKVRDAIAAGNPKTRAERLAIQKKALA